MDAIFAHLTNLGTAHFEQLRFSQHPLGFAAPTEPHHRTPDHLSVRQTPDVLASKFTAQARNTGEHHNDELIAFFERPEHRAAVARAAELMDSLPPGPSRRRGIRHDEPVNATGSYERQDDGTWRETDASLISSTIATGIITQASTQALMAAACIRTLARVAPDLSPDEVQEVLERSVNLLIRPARLRVTQLDALLNVLAQRPDQQGVALPRDWLTVRPSLDPANFTYDPRSRRVTFAKRMEDFCVLREVTVTAEDGTRSVEAIPQLIGEITDDARDLDDPQGCPARIPTDGDPSPIRRKWTSYIEQLAPSLHHMFPSAPVPLSGTLDERAPHAAQPTGALADPRSFARGAPVAFDLRDLRDVQVAIVHVPDAGALTIDDPDGALASLELEDASRRPGRARVRIAPRPDARPAAANETERPIITIRCPSWFTASVSGCSSVVVDGGESVEAVVDDEQFLWCSSAAQRILATGAAVVRSLGANQLDIQAEAKGESVPHVLAHADPSSTGVRVAGSAAHDVVAVAVGDGGWDPGLAAAFQEHRVREDTSTAPDLLRQSASQAVRELVQLARSAANEGPAWTEIAGELPTDAHLTDLRERLRNGTDDDRLATVTAPGRETWTRRRTSTSPMASPRDGSAAATPPPADTRPWQQRPADVEQAAKDPGDTRARRLFGKRGQRGPNLPS